MAQCTKKPRLWYLFANICGAGEPIKQYILQNESVSNREKQNPCDKSARELPWEHYTENLLLKSANVCEIP